MRILSILLASAVLCFSSLHTRAEPLIKSGESIAFMGDSITQSGPGSYVRLVEGALTDQGIQVTVIPAGVSGNKSNDMLARLEKDVLSKKPTWMTLSVGVNDVMHGARGVELEEYKTNITALLDRAEQAGVKVLVLTATQIWLPVTNPENVKLAGYNAFLRETAKARNLPLADLNAAMVAEQAVYQRAGAERSLTFDGVHMNIYGNMVMAKGVLAAFGLNDTQLAAAQAKWNKMPDVYPLTAPPARGTGTGLTGQYFSDGNFTSLVKTQVDSGISFKWGQGSPKNSDGTPMNGIDPKNFSVRWTGQIQALEDGTYTISVNANDTALVWIGDLNGPPLINKTVAGSIGYSNRANFKMAAGQKYDIKIDYTSIPDNAEIALQWIRPGLTRDLVPQSQLYPTHASVDTKNAAVGAAPVTGAPTK
jgi:lysophospholipase L1-like esterase